MLWLALGGAFVVAVLTLCCAALVEVFRQLGEMRSVLNLGDQAPPLNIRSRELSSSDLGLPTAVMREPEVIAIFLSAKCATCIAIAEAFRGGAPGTVWFVLSGDGSRASALWEYLKASEGRVLVDANERIARAIDLNVTPAVFTIRWGEVIKAHAVSSPRQVLNLVPTVAPRGVRGDHLPAAVTTMDDSELNARKLAVSKSGPISEG